MKISVIVGTRPEIIKMSPVLRELDERGLDYFVIHSGQHYSFEMDGIFFKDLNLRKPEHNIEVGSGTHGEETSRMLTGIERILMSERPDVVLVEGDTNTVLAGGLSAAKLGIMVGHIEAGLRSYDRSMPEELNRVLVDHLSDYLFAPTQKSRGILIGEGIPGDSIFVTGNTIVDAVYQNLKISEGKGDIIRGLGLREGRYLLLTLHRQENVDSRDKLMSILVGLRMVSERFDFPIVFPMHPRTERRIKELKLLGEMRSIPNLRVITAVGYLEFLQLESKSKMILTDSGGVQEEACVSKVPCVTIRENTERPETVEVGANMLVGSDPERILNGVKKMFMKRPDWENPFGDGNAGKRIVQTLCEVF